MKALPRNPLDNGRQLPETAPGFSVATHDLYLASLLASRLRDEKLLHTSAPDVALIHVFTGGVTPHDLHPETQGLVRAALQRMNEVWDLGGAAVLDQSPPIPEGGQNG